MKNIALAALIAIASTVAFAAESTETAKPQDKKVTYTEENQQQPVPEESPASENN